MTCQGPWPLLPLPQVHEALKAPARARARQGGCARRGRWELGSGYVPFFPEGGICRA